MHVQVRLCLHVRIERDGEIEREGETFKQRRTLQNAVQHAAHHLFAWHRQSHITGAEQRIKLPNSTSAIREGTVIEPCLGPKAAWLARNEPLLYGAEELRAWSLSFEVDPTGPRPSP